MNTHDFAGTKKVSRGGNSMCRIFLMRLILCISLLIPLTAGLSVSAAPDPALITLDGYLLTSCCYFGKTGSPASHGRGCLKMPTCAHTGYGIAVLNNQGEYDFYFFDGTFYPAAAGEPAATGAQALARAIVETSTKSNHIAIQISGTLSGVTRAQTNHDGTLGGNYAEINIASIQEASAITPVSGDLTGYVIDEDCFTGNTNPGADSIMCLRMGSCAASGYGIAVLQADGTYSFAYFDGTFSTTSGTPATGGQLQTAALLAGTLTENHVTIHVTGQYTGEKIKNTTGTNNNTLYPVFSLSALSEVITPTAAPTNVPTSVPTSVPTVEPSPAPTAAPAAEPTSPPAPTAVPSAAPSVISVVAGAAVTVTPSPTAAPTPTPTVTPTPTSTPTAKPAAIISETTKTGEKQTQSSLIAGVLLTAASVSTVVVLLNRRKRSGTI